MLQAWRTVGPLTAPEEEITSYVGVSERSFINSNKEFNEIEKFDLGRYRVEVEAAEKRLDKLEGTVELEGENNIAEII